MDNSESSANSGSLIQHRSIRAFVSILALALISGCGRTDPSPRGEEPLRYLGIGNSFTWDSTHHLEAIASSQGKSVELFVAGIGGASLETHIERMRLNEQSPEKPEGRPYSGIRGSQETGSERKYSLVEILKEEAWDIVSIQQVSRKSFKPETYEPFAAQLIDTIGEHAPQAEIVVHMTWAYREDHAWFTQGDFTQEAMFAGLSEAYKELAQRYGLRINPIGEALQQARSTPEWTFTFPDPN